MICSKLHRLWISVFILLALIFTANPAWAAETETATDTQASQSQVIFDDLDWTKYYLRNAAFYELDDETIRNARDIESLMAAYQKIDPWADFYDAETYSALVQYHEGNDTFLGIGVFLEQDESGQTYVLGTLAGGSAERSGLRYGDIIVTVDGQDTRTATPEELQVLLQGEDDSFVVIRYEREGQVYENTLSRNWLATPSIRYWLLGGQEGIGYLQVEHFTTLTGDQIAEAIASLQKQGMTALILDLRDCPGGMIDSAIELSAAFGGEGPMLFFVSRQGGWQQFAAVNGVEPYQMPLAVLVNGNSASAAELVAANIQDTTHYPLIGVTTYGKGVVQTLIDLPTGAGLVMTSAKYISHGYQDITQNGGILPDIYVQGAEAQLAAAIASIEEQRQQPAYLKFYVGRSGFALGENWQQDAAGAFLLDGSSYLPALVTLENLGWQLRQQDGIYYGRLGVRRLIMDEANQQLLTGETPYQLVEREGQLYLSAAALRALGHEMEWNSAERSIRIVR